ncbi:trypsin-like serine protease [Sandaracinus amylolyticus]|uniref:trypsin-like serine protease n=1 Tax=Sandaracinus amylolyticus TaxID=927083 RepID=UPI00069E7F42|nr:trypsin-like serine protease [Sandaracinus amylolyticus]
MRRPVSILLLVLAGCSTGTDEPPAVVDGGGTQTPDARTTTIDAGPAGTCDERLVPLVYNGTREPTAMPLTPGQILAIGSWDGCSGTFITDEWVLTARHCGIRVGGSFCVGADPRNPNVCFTAAQVQNHPSQDMTLVRMDAAASSRIAELEPIAINTTMLDDTWLGRTAEAAGYGQQEDGSSGEREFTAEPIVAFESPQFLVIDGMGERGVCFGDSGGPVMIVADDGSVRVAGDLSYGDPNCLGQDRYSRTDLAVEWIESFTGPTNGSTDCATLGSEGRCVGETAVWCDGETPRSERCETCGWDAAAEGYRCITAADPCEGLDEAGACAGVVARWCDRGVVRERDCAACDDGTCGRVDGRVGCVDDPCGGVDYLGRCDGDVAVWCHEGTMLRTRDCAAEGLRCEYVNDRVGYFCAR